MKRVLILLALLSAALGTPALAQLHLPSALQYNVPDLPPPSVVPADSEEEPDFNETIDDTGLIAPADPGSYPVADGTHAQEAKARFTCGPGSADRILDPIRFPGLEPAGHGHEFFGMYAVNPNLTTFTIMRQLATAYNKAGLLASSCAGDADQASLYWAPELIKPNALGDGIARSKKFELVTLYYVADRNGTTQRFRRGIQFIFGRNMDDPNMNNFRALIAANNARSGAPYVQYNADQYAHGYFNCADTGVQSPYLADANGNDALGNCPATSAIYWVFDSNDCWNGHNRSADGYSHIIPAVLGQDGGYHCPVEYPWHLPKVSTHFRFSHLGAADYTTWYASSDAMCTQMGGTNCQHGGSGHNDYIFAHNYKWAKIWMCSIAIAIPGMNCTTPHEMNYSTLGPDPATGQLVRFVSDGPVPNSKGKKLVDLGAHFSGTSANDFYLLPSATYAAPVMGDATMKVH